MQLAMSERASCKASDPDREGLLEAYRKHERVDFFDYLSYAVNALHPGLTQSVLRS